MLLFSFCFAVCFVFAGFGGPGGGFGAPGSSFLFSTGSSSGLPLLLSMQKKKDHQNHHQDHPNQGKPRKTIGLQGTPKV